MFQLVKLSNCIHIYDQETARFVKRSRTNLTKALNCKNSTKSKKELLKEVNWVKCNDPNCRIKKCRQNGHWIPVNHT